MKNRATGVRWWFLLAVLLAGAVHAELFKCVVNGAIVFQDHACATGTQEDLCAPGTATAARQSDLCASTRAAEHSRAAGEPGAFGSTTGSRYAGGSGSPGYQGYGGYPESYAGGGSGSGRVGVRSYTRKDGTYVRSHTRSAPRRR